MAVVLAGLLPVFVLIVIGVVLKRTLMRLDAQWHGLERLTYYVLFPMLLIQTLVKADLSSVPVAGVGGALLLSALLMALLCLAMRPLLSGMGVDGPAFTSIFQGAMRWQTYVALAVAGNLFGNTGLALASVAMVAIIPLVNVLSVAVLAHYAAPERQSVGAILMTVLRNPLIWACVDRACHQRRSFAAAEALAPGRRRARRLVARDRPARHRRRPASRRPAAPERRCHARRRVQADPDAGARALRSAFAFGLSGANLVIVAACSAVPASSSAYVLARQMGGDAPLLAQIITLQTILAAVTMPIVIALVA